MSREEVIRQLVGREQQELALSEQAISEENPEWHELACQHFGTWETALQYAGIDRVEKLVRRQ